MSAFAKHPYSSPSNSQYDTRPPMSNNHTPPYRPAPNGNSYSNGNGNGNGHSPRNGSGNQYPPMQSMPSQMGGPPPSNYYPNQPQQTLPASSPPQEPPHGNRYSSGPPTSGPQEGSHRDDFTTSAPSTRSPTGSPCPQGLSKVSGGRRYELFVMQQPQRARMCGFGDKDRRPITPPPCIKLVITDVASGKEVDHNEIDHGLFVISTDLWHANGKDEVNMVRHSNTSPTISATTPVSFQDISLTPAYSNNKPQSSSFQAEHSQGAPPLYNPYSGPPQVNAYSGPKGGPQSYSSNEYPQAAKGTTYPSQNGYSQPSGASSYYQSAAGSGQMDRPLQASLQGQQNSSHSYGPGGPRPVGSNEMTVVRATSNSAPQGMYTRNLIGSLVASAFRLTDPDDKIGIWFVLQDMSIRTEGHFRLRFSFVNVGVPVSPSPGLPTFTTNKSSAPVLASVYSDVFHVYSAKRFPGVVESTPLSKCFATQGIKIPIRKEGTERGRRSSTSGDSSDIDGEDSQDM